MSDIEQLHLAILRAVPVTDAAGPSVWVTTSHVLQSVRLDGHDTNRRVVERAMRSLAADFGIECVPNPKKPTAFLWRRLPCMEITAMTESDEARYRRWADRKRLERKDSKAVQADRERREDMALLLVRHKDNPMNRRWVR